eukprot:m.359958 g.359958  ORF g.359958 m.359958 type:complete len:56 (+) comp123371_c0_seq1:111-278(+)
MRFFRVTKRKTKKKDCAVGLLQAMVKIRIPSAKGNSRISFPIGMDLRVLLWNFYK